MSDRATVMPLPSLGGNVGAAVGTQALTLVRRSWRLSLRRVDALTTSLALPVILMVMLVYIFGGAIRTGGNYVDYVMPGVLAVCVGFGAGNTAVSVAQDLTTGIIERFRAMDVPGEALINSHVVASVARNLVSCALVLGVAVAIGFRSPAGPLAWLAAAAILALFLLALSWLSAAIGVAARSAEAASGIAFFIAFLAYPSSALVPVQTMPSWLRGVAEAQPITPLVDTIRALLGGMPVGASAWHAVLWSLGISAGSILLAGFLFRRRME
ncbi:MAG TPA: ABC transporter permease [Candidatus Binatia bacterium]|nr:ABC transporter permease [Candidatus Binatia bacterium]